MLERIFIVIIILWNWGMRLDVRRVVIVVFYFKRLKLDIYGNDSLNLTTTIGCHGNENGVNW